MKAGNDVKFQEEFNSMITEMDKKADQIKRKRKTVAVNEECKNLIINYLPVEMDEEHIKMLFGLIGTIDKIHLMRDMRNKQSGPGVSMCYGFVDYKNALDGQRAIELFNGLKLFNKTIKVSCSKPTADENKPKNLYISGLPRSFKQDDLVNLFSKFGKIASSKIVENDTGVSSNFAFVKFENHSEATAAIEATNNTTLPNCQTPIQVRFSKSNDKDNSKRRRNDMNFADNTESYPIYVFNLDSRTDDTALWKLFGAFGAIKNAKVVFDPTTKLCKGYGFVEMRKLEEAVHAIETLNGYSHDGRILQVSFKNKDKNSPSYEMKGLNLTEITGTHNLYVYNINPDTDDATIWRLFGQFGAVKNVKVVRDENTGKAKGFAFIIMKNLDEASDAVKYLNGFSLDNRILQVSFKRDKNDLHNKESEDHEMAFKSEVPDHIATDRSGAVQIFVYNLSLETQERTLWQKFSQFGAVKNVTVVEDKSNQPGYKGHAFIGMKDYKEASYAVGALDGTIIDGRKLQVSFKQKKK